MKTTESIELCFTIAASLYQVDYFFFSPSLSAPCTVQWHHRSQFTYIISTWGSGAGELIPYQSKGIFQAAYFLAKQFDGGCWVHVSAWNFEIRHMAGKERGKNDAIGRKRLIPDAFWASR